MEANVGKNYEDGRRRSSPHGNKGYNHVPKLGEQSPPPPDPLPLPKMQTKRKFHQNNILRFKYSVAFVSKGIRTSTELFYMVVQNPVESSFSPAFCSFAS